MHKLNVPALAARLIHSNPQRRRLTGHVLLDRGLTRGPGVLFEEPGAELPRSAGVIQQLPPKCLALPPRPCAVSPVLL